jgi:hypothetical protein
MIAISQKLKDKQSIWKKRLAKMDLTFKNWLSKEWTRQCQAAQQQLNKPSAMEDELLEMIKVIEGMNNKLVNEVKRTKKDTCVAKNCF